MGLADVLGPDVRGQAVFGVVGQTQGFGFVLELHQADHRAEDFFLGDAHAVVHVGEHRRLDELAAGQVRRQVCRALQAAGQQGGAFLDADADVAGDLVVVGLGDHRADLGLRVLRVADDQALGAGGELGDELVVHRFLDEDPAACGAALAVQGEDGEQRGVQGAVEVGVVEDQHRRLAAQLHGVLLQAGGLHDLAAGGGAAGEGDRAHVRVTDQGVARGGAVTLHHVQHAFGDAGFQGQTAQFVGGQRRQLAHLQHGGVAQGQAGRGLPGGGHEGHVPRRHQAAHTHRLVEGVVEHLVVHRVAVAVHAGADLGEELEVVRGAGDQHILRLVDRQAGVQGFQLGQVRHILVDQLTQLAHQPGAFLGGGVGPLGEGFLGGGHGGGDFLGATAGDFTDGVHGGRVVVDENLFALDFPAVDPVLDHVAHASCCLRAKKASSLTIRLTRRPTPSTSTTTSSPGTTSARPSGVPVAIMSPGCRVMKLEKYSIR
ncbi:hypothetical protein D9M69_462070 [compost metagenome]